MRTPSKTHLAELDVIRFWAFFGVFVFHVLVVQPPAAGSALGFAAFKTTLVLKAAGRFGVDLFFTLSAFLITSLLISERAATGKIHLAKFYMRRILRIWPLYFLVTFLIFGAALWLHESEMRSYFLPFVFFAPNWAWAFLGTPATQYGVFLSLMVFWSLGVEEQFYLFWPLLLRRSTLAGLRQAGWGMLALSALIRTICWANDVPHPGIYANTLAHLDPIAVGVLLAAEWARPGEGAASLLRARILSHPFTMAAGVGLFVLGGWMAESDGINGPLFIFLGYPVVAWGGYLVLFNTLLNLREERPGRMFRAQVHLGRISYGLYVIHGFVLVGTPYLAGWLTGKHASFWRMELGQMSVNFILALAGTIALAHLSYVHFESYFLRMKSKFSGIEPIEGSEPLEPAVVP